jgi:hypothetical protein
MYRESLDTKYIRDVLEIEDFEKVWNLLQEKFHFNVREWKKEFDKVNNRRPRFISTEEAFMIFGKKEIEPLLNAVLKRKFVPTWINILRFVLKEKLERKAARDKFYQGRYNKGV